MTTLQSFKKWKLEKCQERNWLSAFKILEIYAQVCWEEYTQIPLKSWDTKYWKPNPNGNKTMNHIINECSKLAQKKYKTRHESVMHWQ